MGDFLLWEADDLVGDYGGSVGLVTDCMEGVGLGAVEHDVDGAEVGIRGGLMHGDGVASLAYPHVEVVHVVAQCGDGAHGLHGVGLEGDGDAPVGLLRLGLVAGGQHGGGQHN